MSSSLPLQLFLSTGMVALTVLIHLAGLLVLTALLRRHADRWLTPSVLLNQALITLGAVFGLFVLHAAEIWTYALAYVLLSALPTFEAALYFSTSTYASVGYGDITLEQRWRLFGAIEGINGILLLGWSTAFFVSVVQRLRTFEHAWSASKTPKS